MPLQLLPMEESDLYAYQSLFWEAFKDDLMALMYPNGYSEVDKEYGIKFQLAEWQKYPERLKMMKVIDTELPEDGPTKNIVGVSKWKVYAKDRTEEDVEEEAQAFKNREWPPGANVPFFKEFIDNLGKCKKEIVGMKAHTLLGVLATLPSYHRKGVGAMHLKWGLEIADSVGKLFTDSTVEHSLV